MVTIRPKMVMTHRMHGTATTEARTDLSVRGHDITIDERIESGGTNQGISPVETLLTSLVGCTNRITHKVAAANGVDIKAMSVDLESRFDRRGTQLEQEVGVPFPEIRLRIELTTDADETTIEKVKSDLRKFCPIAKVLRAAGTEIAEDWIVKRP